MNQLVWLNIEQHEKFVKEFESGCFKNVSTNYVREIDLDKKDIRNDFHVWMFETKHCAELFDIIAEQLTINSIRTNVHRTISVYYKWDYFEEAFMTVVVDPINVLRKYLSLQSVFEQFVSHIDQNSTKG